MHAGVRGAKSSLTVSAITKQPVSPHKVPRTLRRKIFPAFNIKLQISRKDYAMKTIPSPRKVGRNLQVVTNAKTGMNTILQLIILKSWEGLEVRDSCNVRG